MGRPAPRPLAVAVAGTTAACVVVGVALLAVRDGGSGSGVATSDGTTSGSVSTSSTISPRDTTSTTATTSSGPVVAPEPSTTTTTGAPMPVAQTSPTTTPAPPFQASVEPVTAVQLHASWRPGCPVGVEQLRAVDLSHWGFDGRVHQGRLIVAAAEVDRVIAALRDIYAARFPIERMVPVDAYGGSDDASMADNNTSAFNCRYVKGTTRWSEHSFGRAIDVNPIQNPYVQGDSVDPPAGAPYASRPRSPGVIHAGDAVVDAFAAQGWEWGGYWTSGQDYQHFSASGR